MFSWPNLFKRLRDKPDFSSIHPLVTPEVLERRWKDCGAEWYEKHAHIRGTGRTTALVHAHINVAIMTPNKWVLVLDHAGPDGTQSHRASVELLNLIQDAVKKLGYQHFYFCSRRTAIRFGGDTRG